VFLQLDQLTIRYPAPHGGERAGASAVDGVSFGLTAGQIGVLIGPSGCGKTSVLRAVAGLEPLAGGRITLDGRLLSAGSDAATPVHVAPELRRVGMVFQDYALFPHLSVAQNIGFGLAAVSRSERAARVAELLDLVGLAHTAQRAPHQLSGGQQQRVALARALAAKPALLLLDEPFSSLDIDLRERLAQELRAILKRTGTTALFVTHDQLEAFALGDVVGVMQHGRLEQWAAPYELYHQPATRFVADFIGHGVFAPAERLQGPHGSWVRTPLGDFADDAVVAPDGALEALMCGRGVGHAPVLPARRADRRAAA
jgi:iron(III) transport system ATP-binding protein